MLHSIGIVRYTLPLLDLGSTWLWCYFTREIMNAKTCFQIKDIEYYILDMGYPMVCYPTKTQTLTPNVRVQNHFLQKNYPKYILMFSKAMIDMNIIIKFLHVSHLVCPCFIITPIFTVVKRIPLINNILGQTKLDHFINKYVFQTTLI
jgi:hypothetical protein